MQCFLWTCSGGNFPWVTQIELQVGAKARISLLLERAHATTASAPAKIGRGAHISKLLSPQNDIHFSPVLKGIHYHCIVQDSTSRIEAYLTVQAADHHDALCKIIQHTMKSLCCPQGHIPRLSGAPKHCIRARKQVVCKASTVL